MKIRSEPLTGITCLIVSLLLREKERHVDAFLKRVSVRRLPKLSSLPLKPMLMAFSNQRLTAVSVSIADRRGSGASTLPRKRGLPPALAVAHHSLGNLGRDVVTSSK